MLPKPRAEIKRDTGKLTLDDLRNVDLLLSQLENENVYALKRQPRVHQDLVEEDSTFKNIPVRKRSMLRYYPVSSTKLRLVRNSLLSSSSDYQVSKPLHLPKVNRISTEITDKITRFCRRNLILPSAVSISLVSMNYITISIADETGKVFRVPFQLPSYVKVVEKVLLDVLPVDELLLIVHENLSVYSD
ncbi:hypothetical protein RCL1_000585 [Eukaryota sp. TZLM3-RCL]